MAYTPPDKIIKRYAEVLVGYGLGQGKGLKRGEVVRVSASESAKPLYTAVCNAIVDRGGHVISHYLPDETRDATSGARYFYANATKAQIEFFPATYLRGVVDQIDHSLVILSEADPHALSGVDAKKIMARGKAMRPYIEWRNEKEWQGKYTWTLAVYGTAAMAKEAGLSEKQYWNQIVRACFLDHEDPIAQWRRVGREIEAYRKKLSTLSRRIDRLHVQGTDADLWIRLGKDRRWLAGRGVNIPSFEIFTSPDWRGTEGWIRFNQPLYRYGTKITGIELEFRDGRVVKSKAASNQQVLREMIATEGADRVGEYSLTDKRHSRITKFMADTLYDENMGGPFGNTHLALGMSYRDTYAGNVATLSNEDASALGFNFSTVHTDIISTADRTVTAHLTDGSSRVIYRKGQFTL